MRRAHGAHDDSVQRNVSEAFDSCMRRLEELYKSATEPAPTDFDGRIDFWHAVCGMPDTLRAKMHTLRIWRNASLHHDEQRWASDGPRSAAEASQLIDELESML